jgi:A/G-specific adenine glycosylase
MAEQGLEQVLQAALLAWYDTHARVLPWRSLPGERPDPYRVWLSEVMLQQTTVPAVRSYFMAFTSRWPTVGALAAASLDDVLKAWAGLGYYARARNLHACARTVVERHGGVFPADVEALKALPGIGSYTAGAIAAIAFDLPAAAVDGNVERVMARFFSIETPLPLAKPEIRVRAESLVPERRAGDFAQALMDLGATICAPAKANCPACPWNAPCQGRRLGIADTLPRKVEKGKRPTRRGTVFWAERADGAVLVRTREARGLLGGMTEFPSTEWREDRSRGEPPFAANWRETGLEINHTFTHFHLVLDLKTARVIGEAPPGLRFVARDDLEDEALPSLMRKVMKAARGAGSRR